jgi:hypothetical protein
MKWNIDPARKRRDANNAQSKLAKRLAVYGFLFFLLKGLLWLFVAAVAALFFAE